jgi:hypothetical protein
VVWAFLSRVAWEGVRVRYFFVIDREAETYALSKRQSREMQKATAVLRFSLAEKALNQ